MNMNPIEQLKHLSDKEFTHWGLQELAYIRRITVEGKPAFAVHAADGTQMAVMPDFAVAQAALIQHDLEPMSVH